MFSRCIADSGASLATSISLRDSFIVTPAALAIRVSSYPLATADTVFMLHGAIIIPSARCVPLDIAEAMLESSDVTVASALTSAGA